MCPELRRELWEFGQTQSFILNPTFTMAKLGYESVELDSRTQTVFS